MPFDVKRISIQRAAVKDTAEQMAGLAEEFLGKLIPARDPDWFHFEFRSEDALPAAYYVELFRNAIGAFAQETIPPDADL